MDRSGQIQAIVKECMQRWGKGESVDETSIARAHPELAPELAEELRKVRLVVLAERAANLLGETSPSDRRDMQPAGLRVRCPHCRNAVEILHDTLDESLDIHCESCGGEINFSESAPEQTTASRQLAHFQLETMLGTGTFGSVWRAYDEELDRYVAIKIPRRNQLDPAPSEPFLREARIAAQIEHPNIVTVHEVGRDADTIFIVSDLIQGTPLSQWMQTHTLSPKEIAGLCRTLAEALDHAHQRGVVHRDLKPANVMMDEHGQPHIMDFGLAKRNVGEVTMTADGQVLGTPAYMSPEQARGDSHRVDGRSDMYSLGVILFELLTGELPFRGSAGMMIDQVIHEEPPSPRRLVGNIPRDLETICLKCLAKLRTARYDSAKLLAEELGRFQRGEPILARPLSRVDRTWRWCQRYPMTAVAMGLIVFLAIAGPAFAWYERSLRQELAVRYTERTTMIRQLVEKRSALEQQIADISRSVRSSQPKHAGIDSIARAAAGRYTSQPLPDRSIKGLLAIGMILAAQDDVPRAIAAFELADVRLREADSEIPQATLRLVRADGCVRLSRLYRVTDTNKAVAKAREAEMLASEVLNSSPSLAAYAVHAQARSSLALALGNSGDTQASIDVLLRTNDQELDLQPLLPGDEDALYALASDYFAQLPRLLP